MHLIWPAIKAKFNGSIALKRKARQIYLGFDGQRRNTVLPFIVVDRTGGGPIHTYRQTIEVYDLRFTIFTKREQPELCMDIGRLFIIEFHDNCVWPTGLFLATEFVRTDTGTTGPTVVDDVYQMSLAYQMMAQRIQGIPIAGSAAHGANVTFSGAT